VGEPFEENSAVQNGEQDWLRDEKKEGPTLWSYLGTCKRQQDGLSEQTISTYC
jgi:hypothetical protein